MTTPSMSVSVTKNMLPATQAAQGDFQQAVGDLQAIISNVLDSSQQLTSTAMISDAGRKFGGAVELWASKAADINKQLNKMADFLGVEVQVMLQNEQNGVDIATGLYNIPIPG
jgi:uncharacterized protein YukE